jgi:ubiquinone/menaquinone biosynthesis C-methylase UbiE
MFMIQSTWPQAQLLGVDLSTYKLAIASAKLSTKSAAVAERVKLVHKPAEATGEADGSYDLATVCLVSSLCQCLQYCTQHYNNHSSSCVD